MAKNTLEWKNDQPLPKKGKMVLKFYADWCPPCKTYKTVYEQLAQEYDSLFCLEINVEHNPELSDNFGIRNIPRTIFINDEDIVADAHGFNLTTIKNGFKTLNDLNS